MAIKSYPYSSVDGDRKITASDEAKRLDLIADSGIIFDDATSLECSKVAGTMNVSVAAGSALVAGHAIISDAIETVTLDASDSTYSRIDIIALESNTNTDVRTGRIRTIKGTAAATPVEPALSTEAGVEQIKLAKILIPASVASLSTATLTDMRSAPVGKHTHTHAQLPSSYTMAYNYTNGFLIATNILANSNSMFRLEITGNGHGTHKVLDIVIEGYNDNSTNSIRETYGVALDYWSAIDAFNYNGYLYFWMAYPVGEYLSVNAVVRNTYVADHSNRITSITNAAKPTTGVTRSVTVSPTRLRPNEAPYVIKYEDIVANIYLSGDETTWNFTPVNVTVSNFFGYILHRAWPLGTWNTASINVAEIGALCNSVELYSETKQGYALRLRLLYKVYI